MYCFYLYFCHCLTDVLNIIVDKIAEMNGHTGTEQQILEAAESVFLEKGYKLATTTAIAAKAGVTHAMLHYYFRTKEQIFLKVLDKNMSELFSMLQTVMSPELTFREILTEVVNLHYTFLSRHRKLPALLLEIAGSYPDMLLRYKAPLQETLDTELTRHKTRFGKAVESGKVNRIDPAQLAFQILSMNLSTFLALPVLKNIFAMDDASVAEFLENRRQEIIRTLDTRLFGKEDSDGGSAGTGNTDTK